MANNYTQVTMEPFLPVNIMTEEEEQILKSFGFMSELADKDTNYWFAGDYSSSGMIETSDADILSFSDDDLACLFQSLIERSNGRLKYICLHAACTCSKMRPDEFGGWVMFVHENGVERSSTWEMCAKFRAMI